MRWAKLHYNGLDKTCLVFVGTHDCQSHGDKYDFGKSDTIKYIMYPQARRDSTHEGDSYRWLESPDSKEAQEWVSAQNSLTESILDADLVQTLKAEMEEVVNYEKFGAPNKHGAYYYHFHNSGLDNHSILYRSTEPYGSDSEVFFDPNQLSKDGTVSCGTVAFSHSGKLFGYIEHVGGSDWGTIHVMTAINTVHLEDTLKWVKFSSLTFTLDDTGLYYSRYPQGAEVVLGHREQGTETDTNLDHAVYYHHFGTSQEDDVLVFKPDNNTYTVDTHFTDDYKFLQIVASDGCKEEHPLYYMRAEPNQPVNTVVRLIDNYIASYTIVHNTDKLFYCITNLDAPTKRLVSVDINSGTVTELIPERGYLLKTVAAFNEGRCLACVYLMDVHDNVELYDIKTDNVSLRQKLWLPSYGSVVLTCLLEDAHFYYSFTSYIHPNCVYHYDLLTDKHTLIKDNSVVDYNVDEYIAEQLFYSSKDGTIVPMYLVRKKTTVLPAPIVLYGYGGFGISIEPAFSPTRIVLMKRDIMYVVANLRGGGEYGREWHRSGQLHNKQNTFDDFQYAAQYLIDNGYTSAKQLSIEGASNGGLLVGACITQRPDLYACAIAQVGVLDMLRFHKFTIGHSWTSDYGNPDVAEDREYLLSYSPYHNVRTAEYPAVLCLTGDHDDRVVPLHTYKFVAELQHKNPHNPRPLLALVDVRSGHGAGKPLSKVLETRAKINAFILQHVC